MVTKILDRISRKSEDPKPKDNNEGPSQPTRFGDPDDKYKMEIVWRNVILFLYLHTCAVYGLTLPDKQTTSVILAWIFGFIMAFGTTVGSHRLFTHRSFKANAKLRFLLVLMQTFAVQDSVYQWVRDHRVHHKFTDTNADPHNSRRGFFFSHIGWLMCKKHPEVKKFGAKIDMSDLEADPFVMFQHKYYLPLVVFVGFVFPMSLCYYLGETFHITYYGHISRYLIGLHLVWMINSVSHFWGYKPYDRNISSTDSWLVGAAAVGEGWHNYHHVFPWDYKAAELPSYGRNLSLAFIDFFAWLGWATDLKTVSDEMIKSRVLRTGDGSHTSTEALKVKGDDDNNNGETDEDHHIDLWGWDDKEMTDCDRKYAKILYKCFD